MAYEFSPEETIAESVVRCAREELARAVGALTEEIRTDPVSAVHGARKAIKKERGPGSRSSVRASRTPEPQVFGVNPG